MTLETTTTIPDTLELIFLKFRGFLPANAATHVTIFEAWLKTFEGSSVRQAEMFSQIGRVAEMLEETLAQVEALDKLNPTRKSRAMDSVSIFLPAVNLSTINQHGSSVYQNCSVENCGSLGLLSDVLRSQFSENVFSNEDALEIVELLKDIRSQLNDQGLPLRLRLNLVRQVDALIWRLQHPELENLQQAVDALGRAALTANQLERICPESDAKGKAKELRVKLIKCFAKSVNIMERGGTAIHAGSLVYDGVIKLLDVSQ